METKILFLDLDGTLLDSRKEIPPGNQAAVARALARGHRVVIASGRPLHSAMAQARRVGLDGPGCYVIAYNGACIYDCGAQKELFRRPIALDALYTLFDEANRRGVHIQTYDRAHVLVEPRGDDAAIRRYCELTGTEFRVIDNIRHIPEPPLKALLIARGDHRVLAEIEAWLAREMGGRLNSFFSSQFYLEVTPAGINKGVAAQKLCQLLGIPVERSVAVGDEANDIAMLQAAGLGAAVANAVPAVKAVAGYVAQRDNDHDGVAEVIDKFLLSE